MELKSQGNAQEQLLFQLLGIASSEGSEDKAPQSALLLGSEAPTPAQLQPYLRLPDPQYPDREAEELARLLGRAIGIGKVHL